MPPHLSTELLENIFKNFATPLEKYWGRTISTPEETFRDEREYFEETRRYKQDRHQLASLALVSREFYANVKPLLYTHIRLLGDRWESCEEVKLFVRTLASNVDLRYLVRSLSLEVSLDEGNVGQDVWSPDEWTFWSGYKLCLDALGTEIPFEDLEGGEPSLVAHQPIEPDHWNEDMNSWAPPEDVAAILLYWLSNLTKLQIGLVPDYEYESDSAGIWRCKGLLECMRSPFNYLARADNREDALNDPERLARNIPAALLSTTDLVMANPHERPFWVKASYPPLKYCSFADIEPWWHLPALQKLTLHRVAEEYSNASSPPPCAIQDLALFDCCTSPDQLSKITKLFSNLRSLRYSMPEPTSAVEEGMDLGTRPFESPAIVKTILQHCTSLDSLELSSLAFQPFERVLLAFEFQVEDFRDPDREEEYTQARETRSYLAHEIAPVVDLRWNTTLTRLSCHMVDVVGWTPKWSIGEAVDVHIARVLPHNLQHLKLRYDGLFGAEDGFSETTFDHLRDLIQDCRELTLVERDEHWLPHLDTIVLDVVETWKDAEGEIKALQEAALAKGIRLMWEWHEEAVE